MTLSDSSGSGLRCPTTGYLTGYPLVESGFYVLARTWPAPEMPRPGCVWTHSLLIDFTELATLPSVTKLLSFFRRPESDNFSVYSKKFAYSPVHREKGGGFSVRTAELLVASLYEEPKSRVVLSGTDDFDEMLILKVWSQQWPRLRRAFRFCTYSAEDRSTKTMPFDLQILPPDSKGIRSRFINSLEVDHYVPKSGENTWIKNALEDLEFPNKSGLRTFLHQVGGDIVGGREVFALLCRLHSVLTSNRLDLGEFVEAIEQVEKQFVANQGRAVRLAIARVAIRNVRLLDHVALDFLVRNLNAVANDVETDELLQLGQALWGREPKHLVQIFKENTDWSRVLVENTLLRLPLETLIVNLQDLQELILLILDLRPEIVGGIDFWDNVGELGKAVLEYIVESQDLSAIALSSLVSSKRADLCLAAVDLFGNVEVGKAIFEGDPYSIDDLWIIGLASNLQSIAELLSQGTPLHKHLLWRLLISMERTKPFDKVVADLWVTAWNAAHGEIESDEHVYIFAFIMACLLNSKTGSFDNVLLLTFDRLYEALETREMPQSAWDMLNRHLPWLSWDPCVRLCDAVAQLCVDQNLSAQTFVCLASNNKAFEDILYFISFTMRGRDYLDGLLKSVRDGKLDNYEKRFKMIKKFV